MSFTSERSRWSDVRLAAASRAVSVCGDFLAATTLALVLQQNGHGGLAVSGLLLAAGLPLAVLAPVTGRLADRADSRTLLVATAAAQAAVCCALAFVAHPVLIIALVALLACGLAVTQPVLSALLPAMVRAEDLPRASGISQTAGQIGMLAGPALGGILVGQTGSRLPLLLDAASYLALVAAGLLVRTRLRGGGTARAATLTPWRLRDDRGLTVMSGVLAAIVLGVSAINVFDVFFIRETLGASATVYGLVGASWTVGMLIGAAGLSRTPPRRITLPVLVLLAAGTCLPVIAAAAVGNAYWIIPLWIAGGICNGGINVFVMVVISGRTPTGARGRAFASFGATVQGAGMLGLMIAGPLVDRFPPRALVAAAGLTGLVIALGSLPFVRREPPSLPAHPASAPQRDSVEA